MLAEQLGNLAAAEYHFEQQLTLAPAIRQSGDNGLEHAARYTDVMKVRTLSNQLSRDTVCLFTK